MEVTMKSVRPASLCLCILLVDSILFALMLGDFQRQRLVQNFGLQKFDFVLPLEGLKFLCDSGIFTLLWLAA